MQLSWKQENQQALKNNYDEAMKDQDFHLLVDKLKISAKDGMKMTSQLENTVCELKNCQKCKGLFMCKSTYEGHISMPKLVNNRWQFSYTPCHYTKQMLEEKALKEKMATLNDWARMKDIDVSDKARVQVIKWLDSFFLNYRYAEFKKGLYLHGSFGSGKTFLISALFHELTFKKFVTTEILYFPEILRTLKNDWDLYEQKIQYYENVDLLCIDDIGAEKVSDWSRDEVLGTILQTRMNHKKTTFFTSNLSLEELEAHFKTNTSVEESLKARRIMERIKFLSEPIELISMNRR